MLDPSLTFERFVLGATNELAATAARRTAESPGRAYSPLLICGRPGVGKTHLLHAIGNYATALEPDLTVHVESADLIAHRVTQGVAAGDLAPLTEAFTGLDLLLIDEVERLSGMERTQEELLAISERMAREGRQLVLASVLPPTELPGFIPELAAIVGRGLVVEIGAPDEEMRRALVERTARERGKTLTEELLRSISAQEFPDIRSLRAAVADLLELAAAEHREPRPADVYRVVEEGTRAEPSFDEFGSFLDDVSRTLAAVVETAPWRRRLAEAILRWEGEGVRTNRLEDALEADTPPDVEVLLDAFTRDANRLLQIRREMGRLGATELPDDPGDLATAEAALETIRAEATPTSPNGGAPEGRPVAPGGVPAQDSWFLNPEKVLLNWIDLDGRLVEEPR